MQRERTDIALAQSQSQGNYKAHLGVHCAIPQCFNLFPVTSEIELLFKSLLPIHISSPVISLFILVLCFSFGFLKTFFLLIILFNSYIQLTVFLTLIVVALGE